MNKYLKSHSTSERLNILSELTNDGEHLALDLVHDLFELDLDEAEKIALLRSLDKSHFLFHEDFVTRAIFKYNQNIASSALWEWANNTDCILWYRAQLLGSQPHVSQRIKFTLLDVAHNFPSYEIIEKLSKLDHIDEYSEAYLSLLYTRALEWNISSAPLLKVAKDTINSYAKENKPTSKHIPDLCYFVLKYEPKFFQKLKNKNIFLSSMTDLIDDTKFSKKLESFHGLNFSSDSEEKIKNSWPNRWQREDIKEEALRTAIINIFERDLNKLSASLAEYLSGVGSQKLYDSVSKIENEEVFCKAISAAYNYFSNKDRTKAQALINNMAAVNPDILNKIPKLIAVEVPSHEISENLKKIRKERKRIKSSSDFTDTNYLENFFSNASEESADANRKIFFNSAFRNMKEKEIEGKGFWSLALKNWESPDIEDLDSLSEMSRQGNFYTQHCYLSVLSKFVNEDKAALKLLDFIRSDEPAIIRAVINALAKINTPRSHMELIAFITRPNTTLDLKMHIISMLSEMDLSNLQRELRAALNDINEDDSEQYVIEVKDSLRNLLTIEVHEDDFKGTELPASNTEELDKSLSRKIDNYSSLLSSEAKRALRTAEFFQLSVESSKGIETIDLSPAIDMQYKALEISFREHFEKATLDLIKSGVLQEKLDLIGYARPIPKAMEEFERYLGSLPIIKEIPFFSKFKLRKMLRGICQYKPGKRFTLDGLKAFALFFICFSRKECKYGLENLFPIPNWDEKLLFEYCTKLHVFQDFRNRAAHEGFHPSASNDLDGIWTRTIDIIEGMDDLRKQVNEIKKGQDAS